MATELDYASKLIVVKIMQNENKSDRSPMTQWLKC